MNSLAECPAAGDAEPGAAVDDVGASPVVVGGHAADGRADDDVARARHHLQGVFRAGHDGCAHAVGVAQLRRGESSAEVSVQGRVPGPVRRPVGVAGSGVRAFCIREVAAEGDADLTQIGSADDPLRDFARLANRGHEHGDQHREDGKNDEEFDEGEGADARARKGVTHV